MKSRICLSLPVAVLITTACAHAQGTAFTYQGRLQDGTNHANGFYDLTFSIWTSAAGPAQIGATVTNVAIGVTNGLFAVALDFGNGVFDGNPRWLEIGVRTNGGSVATTLSPRQPLTAAPYAIYAGNVNAAGISGTIPASNIGNGTITSNMLAPGAAAANFAATGATILSSDPNATNLTAAGYRRIGGPLDLSWQQITGASTPAARSGHTAVWTGSKMIVWGGSGANLNLLNTGATYDPSSGTWSSVTTNNAPTARQTHAALWTGSEMIVWGGSTIDGARYNPGTEAWSPLTTSNAPALHGGQTPVWAGAEMILWGGVTNDNYVLKYFNDGCRYNPASNSWVAVSTNGAPTGRANYTTIWTGTEVIIWGGSGGPGGFTMLNDGGRYNPTSDNWLAISTNGAPVARADNTAVWTGSEMIIWGGLKWTGSSYIPLNDGGRYNPATDTWSALSTSDAPVARSSHTAVWADNEMIIWGGAPGLNTGGRYNPANDSWSPVPTTGAPDGRYAHRAVWTGSEMIVFGGVNNGQQGIALGDTYAYSPSRVMFLYLKP